MAKVAVYPGTFDPITLGHLNIIARAATLFDGVIVGVADSVGKSPMYTVDQRVSMVQVAVQAIPGVSVKVLPGVTVTFARAMGAQYLVRGLRSAVDFDQEVQLASMNQTLSPEIETVFFSTDPQYAYISSSVVRELIRLKAFEALQAFLPKVVLDQL